VFVDRFASMACKVAQKNPFLENELGNVSEPVVPSENVVIAQEELRVGMIGNVDSGKSTLVGVLSRGNLDDGRGKARGNVFRHPHERERGQTSSATVHIMGFDEQMEPVHQTLATHNPAAKTRAWQQVVKMSKKVVSFVDLAGHERYLKTTVTGLTGTYPDYCCVLIGANMGISRMTQEHIGVALALKIPFFVCITKVDICPKDVLKNTMTNLSRLLKSSRLKKMPILIRSEENLLTCLGGNERGVMAQRVCPVFLLSAVTGQSIDLLRIFLGRLEADRQWAKDVVADRAVLRVEETFSVTGVSSVVVSGTITSGIIRKNSTLLLGPFSDGTFIPTLARSLRYMRTPVESVEAGRSCCVALKSLAKKKPLKRDLIHRGMVLIDGSGDTNGYREQVCREFEAEVFILHHPTTITSRYHTVLHIGSIRQTATIVSMEKDPLRTGDRCKVRFRFVGRPELLSIGSNFLFREGGTRGIGTITQLFPHA
jgi:GTPase